MRMRGQLSGVPSFHHVGSKALTQASKLGGKCLYQLSDLAGALSFLRHRPFELHWGGGGLTSQ